MCEVAIAYELYKDFVCAMAMTKYFQNFIIIHVRILHEVYPIHRHSLDGEGT